MDLNAALIASQEAVDHMNRLSESAAAAWTTPRAPGKWSPSQVVEHVARSLEESAKVGRGEPSKFPRLPAVLRPIMRTLFFRRVLKKQGFPKARTNAAMNPSHGPMTPAEGRIRLETAHGSFHDACRQLASRGEMFSTTIFGRVPVVEYVRFMEIHTRHHSKQIGKT